MTVTIPAMALAAMVGSGCSGKPGEHEPVQSGHEQSRQRTALHTDAEWGRRPDALLRQMGVSCPGGICDGLDSNCPTGSCGAGLDGSCFTGGNNCAGQGNSCGLQGSGTGCGSGITAAFTAD